MRLIVRRTKPSARHANKSMGLRQLPSTAWTVNQGWVLAANVAADLDAWTRVLRLHDQPDLTHAEPGTLRYRLLQGPEELAEVLIYLCSLASRFGIDLEDAFRRKEEINKKRRCHPAEQPDATPGSEATDG